MLEYLRIKDLALIADVELEFASGMNVLTGETGAGKSFILKALNFIMGERLGSDMVRPGKERAQVEALFSLPEGDLVLRRDLLAETGRSRLYLNDNLSSQETIRELRPTLIMHTSQHGQQRLLQPSYQGKLVDDWINRPDLLEQKDALLRALREAATQREALSKRSHDLSDRRELLEIHLKVIEKVNPEPGEEERLEIQRLALKDGEQQRKQYERALQAVRGEGGTGLLDNLSLLERSLEVLARQDEQMASDFEATVSFRQTLGDLEKRLRRPPSPLPDVDSEEVEARLFELSQLKRKLHRTLPEILALRDEIEENLSFLDICALDIKHIEKQEAELCHNLAEVLHTLTDLRHEAGQSFCTALESELAGLGFSEHVRVMADFTPHELAPACIEERVRLLWAPNPGQHPQPLDRIASGGELSRFLLAVVSLQSSRDAATLIFDEVDAGVGGVTLNRVADRLAFLADQRQMLLITHWPQLASRATRHFCISKEILDEETFTRCNRLNDVEKELELARMAGIEHPENMEL